MKSIKALAVLFVLALSLQQVSAQADAATGNCPYCKLMDTMSGPIYSYGYCETTDMCFGDVKRFYTAIRCNCC